MMMPLMVMPLMMPMVVRRVTPLLAAILAAFVLPEACEAHGYLATPRSRNVLAEPIGQVRFCDL